MLADRFEHSMRSIPDVTPFCYWVETKLGMIAGTRCMSRRLTAFTTNIWQR